MSDASSSQRYISPKRSACDRCRGHKLRCPRRNSMTDVCDRCARLGLRCVSTSYRTSEYEYEVGPTSYRISEYECGSDLNGRTTRPGVAQSEALLPPFRYDNGELLPTQPSDDALIMPVPLQLMEPPENGLVAGCISQQNSCDLMSQGLLQGLETRSDFLTPLSPVQSMMLSLEDPLLMQDQLRPSVFNTHWDNLDATVEHNTFGLDNLTTVVIPPSKIYPAIDTHVVRGNETSLLLNDIVDGATTGVDKLQSTSSSGANTSRVNHD